MTRNDPFGPPHEALRALLFETALGLGRERLDRQAMARESAGLVRHALARLGAHAGAEDALVLPRLAGLAPELAADLRSAHARLAGLERELAALAERLEHASDFELEPLASRLHRRFLQLVAEHLLHMEFEECAVTRMLAAHAGAGELEALSRSLLEAASANAVLAEPSAVLSLESRS
jgi:hypothetical protein